MQHEAAHTPEIKSTRDLLKVALGALGVVYGDIGTSPLYALKECFNGPHAVTLDPVNVLGVLSLVFWSLVLVVVVKYLIFVMRADNHGEGGIMALLALLAESPEGRKHVRGTAALVLLALFGTALLLADGMITPAISVLSAVEGLEVATPVFKPYVVPVTVAILVLLFVSQKRGTAGVAAVFGPATLLWFVTIAALGLPWILRAPGILTAVNPINAVRFFVHNGWHGAAVLGSVVLCITGAEALYADMGHFGPRPIRVAWFVVVFPALLLSYFGQGALLLLRGADPEVVAHPFFSLAPTALHYPVVGIATIATVIASQALISGAFSIAQQAIQLGYSPRLNIVHTSSQARGQIYVPEVNTLLLVACVALVLNFKSSSALAAAYGISVMGTMLITTILMFAVAHGVWRWHVLGAAGLLALFLAVEVPFLGANLTKVAHGGWFPLVVGLGLFVVMTTWKRGRSSLVEHLRASFVPVEKFMAELPLQAPLRVKGTAVFMTGNRAVIPPVLLHHFKHNRVLHEQVVLLSVVTAGTPQVRRADRVQITDRGDGFYEVVATYGFMQVPNVPEILRLCQAKGLICAAKETSYYLGRETLLTTGKSGLWRWRKALFGFLSRNARPATAFFGIPPSRVVELGTQIEL
ncbi:MAG: potassium transporter Kup [Deltaproteobacteria bacterium]|nr:potassium transporter Kup [Deltaproteobacteria bacterium]